MRVMTFVCATSFLILGSPAMAAAQTCFGNVAVSSAAPVAFVGGPYVDETSHSFFGGVTAGTDRFFGQVGASRASIDGSDEAATTLRAGGGLQFQGRNSRLHACPYVSASRSSGPNTTNYDLSYTGLTAGIGVGVVAMQSASLAVVPSANLSMTRSAASFDFGGAAGTEKSTSNFGALGVGVGFVIHERVSIQPSLFVSLGLDELYPGFQLEVGWSLFKR